MATGTVMREYLRLAERLLAAADQRPDERMRLANAANVAKRLAELSRYEDVDADVPSWLAAAAELLRPGVDQHIELGVVTSASCYADLAHTVIRQEVDERLAAARAEREAVGA